MRQTLSAPWALQAGLCWLAALAGQITASPVAVAPSGPGVELQSRSEPVPLRIMPLGASITAGYKSTDENGYRKELYDHLHNEKKWSIEMVGSLRNGTLGDNDHHEGHVGFVIEQIDNMADKIIEKKPGLILINLGTNDATKKLDVHHAGDRMDKLLEKLYNGISGTTVILSTLLVNGYNQKNIDIINKQYRTVVSDRLDKGYRIVLAEMNTTLTTNDLQDKTHPTNDGYKEMAKAWYEPIKKAQKAGMFKEPISTATRSSAPEDSEASEKVQSSSPPSQTTTVETSGAVSHISQKKFWTWVYSLL